ncbi:MAG: SDR family NAD(P)-dependent oxidoreductase [Pseudomonadota bacterium]
MHVLVTGANRGLGAALCDVCRARGDQVTATSRDAGTDMTLDVTRPDSHAALAARLDGARIDLLVCNAGIYPDKGQPLADGYPAQMWADAFATNVTGVFLTVQSLLPNLQCAETPKIAILSSTMASHERAPGGSYIYRASKAAVLNLGRNLARDLHDLGIAVGIYHPGWARTDMGGAQADVSVAESVAGLMARFDALSLDTTGCFETWQGQAHPF